MCVARPASPSIRSFDWSLLAIGAAFGGSGIYFAPVGFGLAPTPSTLYGPNWLSLAVGLLFFGTSLCVQVRGWLGIPDSQPNLPEDTPLPFVAVQWLAAFVVITGMASIGTWIAFGAGTRHFAMSVPVFAS